MTTAANPTRRLLHEIPNSQVLDVAEQFHNAYLLTIKQPPGSGVLLPALHCASIALELYLKSLSARGVEVPDALFAGAVYVHAQSPYPHHKLDDLFDQAPADAQQVIETQGRSGLRLQEFPSVRAALVAHNPMFMASRYVFEPGRTLDGIKIELLGELLDVLKTGVRAVPHHFVLDPAATP